jgi:Tannase and feruloyl esterase
MSARLYFRCDFQFPGCEGENMLRMHLVALLSLIALHSQVATAAVTCGDLKNVSLPNAAVTSAQTVAAGQFVPAAEPGRGAAAPAFKDAPEFCRVAITSRPSSDSDVKIKIWLPASRWNGNFQGVGNDGGFISYPQLAGLLQKGFAAASTDTGHGGGSASMAFAPGHPEKVTDFAYRAFHEMTVDAKTIISAYYGKGPELSVLDECGGGTREALAEAQRYPDDYDALSLAGLANYKSLHHLSQMWSWQTTHTTEASYIPPAKYPAIHQAALDACDSQVDGVKDGLIEDPSRCHFDPKVIECQGADTATCLTPAQVEAARTLYTPRTHAKTKKDIFSPLYPGSELAWGSVAGPNPYPNGVEYFKYVLFEDPNWDPKTRPINFDSDVDLALSPQKSLVNAANPDLRPFFSRGGKLLMVEGWNDTAIPPRGAIDYFKAVVDKVGATTARNNIRLFMVPGMGHCPGINGAENFNVDMLGTVRQWKDSGKTPDQIVTTRYQNGKEVGKRLVCAYPSAAIYKGTGNPNDASNFTCGLPK